MQEDRLSLNAVEYVARAATSTAILTSVDVPSRAGLEESHKSFRTRNIDEEKGKGSEKSAARRFASPANDDTPTPDSVAQAKAPVPREVRWTGPPRESHLLAMYNDTLDLPIMKWRLDYRRNLVMTMSCSLERK